MDENRKLTLVRGIISFEIKEFILIREKANHSCYNRIMGNSKIKDVMYNHTETLPRGKEPLNRRQYLSESDIKNILKSKAKRYHQGV